MTPMRKTVILFSVFLMIAGQTALAALAKPVSLEAMRSRIDRLAEESDPDRMGRRWETLLPPLEQHRHKLDQRLNRQGNRIAQAQAEAQELRERLQQLQGEEAFSNPTQTVDVLLVSQMEARLQQELEQVAKTLTDLRQRQKNLAGQKSRRQARQVQPLVRQHVLEQQSLQVRREVLTEQPDLARRLMVEGELQQVLNRLTDAERRVDRLRWNRRPLEKKQRQWLALKEDLWGARLQQVNGYLQDLHAPPFLQSLRYTLKDGTACYAADWKSGPIQGHLTPWTDLLQQLDRWQRYRQYVAQEHRLAQVEVRQARRAYRTLQDRVGDRRLFELQVRLGLETLLPVFVETPGLGRDLLRSWNLSSLDGKSWALQRLPGTLLRVRQGVGMDLFDQGETGAVELPPGDPLLRSWAPVDWEAWLQALQPWIARQVELESEHFAQDGKLQQPSGLRHWPALVQRVEAEKESPPQTALDRRAVAPGLDAAWLKELSTASPKVFQEAALAELRLALALLHRSLVEQKREAIHRALMDLATTEAPQVLQQLETLWQNARTKDVSLPWQAACSAADNGVLTLGFSRAVKLEEARINDVPLILTGPGERTDQFRLFLPPRWKAGAPNRLSVKARLKRRMLPTHQLDVDPTSRSLPLLQPDGSLVWKNYQPKSHFSGKF